MQILNAMVALTGDRNNMLYKEGLTPPEIVLLQQLHGEGSILQIEPVGEQAREPLAEISRLKELYPLHHARIQDIWRDFPGAAFPVRIDMLALSPALLKAAEASAPYMVDVNLAKSA